MDYYDESGMPHHIPDGTPDDPIYVHHDSQAQQRYVYASSPFDEVGDWLREHFPRAHAVLSLCGLVLVVGVVLWLLITT